MKLALLFAGAAAALTAADLDLGAKVFRQSCAVGYCHGAGGTQGRAPKLTGRNFDPKLVQKVTLDGIPNTGMPGWKERLNQQELDGVIAYVVKISGGDPAALTSSGSSGGAVAMPPEVRRGKELFFDAVRGVNRCGTCHSIEEMGIPIGPNLAIGSHDTAAIRAGKPAQVRQARTSDGDTFPALLVEQQAAFTRVYDLKTVPPVLRTFTKGEITLGGGSTWSHSKAVGGYSDAELSDIASYLKWVASR